MDGSSTGLGVRVRRARPEAGVAPGRSVEVNIPLEPALALA